ncbi:MAG: aminoglycoside phosphotransferase [Fibrobacteres bacterium]|nr:aminoglycoside phosphotransferase [Fibrobacterota bacterium]
MLELKFSELSPVLVKFLARYGFGENCAITLAGTAGSRRVYFRLQEGLRNFIVLVSPSDDADFGRFLRITQFYRLMNFPVPMVYCIDDAAHQVILEDLGDRRLYDCVKAGEPPLELYRKVIYQLVDLQTRCFQRHQECPDIRSRLFDEHDLLWETEYYATQYLQGHRGIAFPPAEKARLDALFKDLAHQVDLQPKSIMHRDFQSQNLMIQFDGNVRVIDYQGSRLGSVYYDLASLLLDPYTMLSDADITELLRYYHAQSLNPLPYEDMFHQFLLAASQRVMQALGAYCFLSRVKGLTQFREYIQPGEKRLAWILDRLGWPELKTVLPKP